MHYTQSSARLKKIEEIFKVAAKQGSSHFIRQSLGHALYTVREIKKASVGRKKRCSLCADAMRKFMTSIETAIGKEKFTKFVGNTNKDQATLMFAIDDTGSMHDEIQAAKDIATYIVRDISRPKNLKVDYILSPFNDPGRFLTLKQFRASFPQGNKSPKFLVTAPIPTNSPPPPVISILERFVRLARFWY